MTGNERREQILCQLSRTTEPVSASALASALSVSRQIIVGDIAILRASGEKIDATPRGYVLQNLTSGVTRRIACNHDSAQMEAELNAIVDMGCEVIDVIVEHPIYGQLTGTLNLKSRYDVECFVQKSADVSAHPLSELTEGIHLHTISCTDESAYRRVLERLDRLGVLISNE